MRTLLTAASAVVVILSLAACSSPAPHVTATRSSAHTAKALASDTPDPNIAVTCAGLTELQTNLQAAETELSAGTIEDDGYAAIVNLASTNLSALSRTPNRGLVADLASLQDAISTSPPTVKGAKFNPDGATFTSAMQDAVRDCQRNDTPLVAYAPVDQG
ncbi:hypothetical protein [Curtobacterium sp. MCBD17_040]|uniref:hypothetical protein n=1 Tax=Curtobacterium sp. MCBD17_040 TaxID=2175674 RepID=UPI0011B6A2DB|nr:hypothetical protein [Curtobacterium sp. MCBD17_040]WIB65521.1 hypothetical protein DEI94_19295 [Curtobacterium sp. MCBD17_040]